MLDTISARSNVLENASKLPLERHPETSLHDLADMGRSNAAPLRREAAMLY
jgi:hypothetical protein